MNEFYKFWNSGIGTSKHKGHHYDDVKYGWESCEKHYRKELREIMKNNARIMKTLTHLEKVIEKR